MMTFVQSEYTRALIFENPCQHLAALQDAQRERGKDSPVPPVLYLVTFCRKYTTR
jgi:hypothetical protein